MIYSEEFLELLKKDPLDGTVRLIKIAREHFHPNSQIWSDDEYDVLLEAYALVIEISDSGLLNVSKPAFGITGNKNQDCKAIHDYMMALEEYCISESSKLRVASLKSHFKVALGSGFAYEFSQGDLERVQVLINQIRDLIAKTTGLESDHKRRLLARVERLQSALHKKVSDLDRFWGMVGDAGVVLGKLGKDAKPIVDRVREIADIVWRTQSRAEELPSGTQIPLLTDKTGFDEGEA